MKAKTIKDNSPGQIAGELRKHTADGFEPTLAIVFLSIKQNRKAITK